MLKNDIEALNNYERALQAVFNAKSRKEINDAKSNLVETVQTMPEKIRKILATSETTLLMNGIDGDELLYRTLTLSENEGVISASVTHSKKKKTAQLK